MYSRGARSAIAVFVAVCAAAMAPCSTEAATVVLKIKDEYVMPKPKPSTVINIAASNSTIASVLNILKNVNSTGSTQNSTNVGNTTDMDDDDVSAEDEPMSAMWYLGAFGGLVLFFFVVTCSELFFGHPMYVRRQSNLPHAGNLRRHVYGLRNQKQKAETPPPPYHLFAPPSYDDLQVKGNGLDKPKFLLPPGCPTHNQRHVYVVPVNETGQPVAEAVAASAADMKRLAVMLPSPPPSQNKL